MSSPARDTQVQGGTAVTVVEKNHVVALLRSEEAQRRIAPMLGPGEDAERVLGEFWLALQQNPEIGECTPASIVTAVARAAATGGTIGRDVHLVPFNVNVAKRDDPPRWEKRLQAIEDYKFIRELMVRTGGARSVRARAIFANERFVYREGTVTEVEHDPILDSAQRGALVGAYAIARVPGGDLIVEIMDRAEIEAIRQKNSKQWKKGELDALIWYAIKTVLRRIGKAVPRNPRLAQLDRRLQAALAPDEEFEQLIAGASVSALPSGECHGHASELPKIPARGNPLVDNNGADLYGEPAPQVGTPVPAAPPLGSDSPFEEPAPGAADSSSEISMEAAEQLPFPWAKPPQYVGKRLKDLPTRVIQRILTWCEGKVKAGDAGPVVLQYAEATALIMTARPDVDAAPAPDPTQTAMALPEPTPAARVDTTLRPGKVEDALPKPEPKVARDEEFPPPLDDNDPFGF